MMLLALTLAGLGVLGAGPVQLPGLASLALAADPAAKSRRADKGEKAGKASRTRPNKARRNAPRSTPRRTNEPPGPRDVPEGAPPREREDNDGVDGRASAAAPATNGQNQPATAARAGKPRVYTFGGLDLEGKLKTPQLLYFRGRMRQELDASSLQRRSFMKELENSAEDRGL